MTSLHAKNKALTKSPYSAIFIPEAKGTHTMVSATDGIPPPIFLPCGEIMINGKTVPLTDHQKRIVAFLAKNEGRTTRMEELYLHFYGEKPPEKRPNYRTLKVHVFNIRAAIKEVSPGSEGYLHTVWGIGYRLSNTPKPVDGTRPKGVPEPGLGKNLKRLRERT